jgi:hypothetical protein
MATLTATTYPTEWGSDELQHWMVSEFQEGWEVMNDLLLQNGIVDGATLLGKIDTVEVDESFSDFLPVLLTAVECLRDVTTHRNFCEALQLQRLEDEQVIDEDIVQYTKDALYTNLVCETLPRKYDPVGSSGSCGSVAKSSHVEIECTACRDEVSFVSFSECGHAYCKTCLRKLFDVSMSGERELPVKCCSRKTLSLDLITDVVTSCERHEYVKRIESQSQKYENRLCCPV